MQRFLMIYTFCIMVSSVASGVWATETDRYGNPTSPVLASGEWWKTKAISAEETRSRSGEFVIVKGRVLSTFQTREDLYLNFGEDYKTDFTVRIPKRAWKQFGDMKGKEIIVRGVLREYNGPMIVADFKEQIHEN